MVRILSEGLTTSAAGRSRVFLHHDQVQRRLRARPGARIAAIANAGAIPDLFSIRVIADDDKTVVGTVDEEFATESQAGDIFLLGNTSWRIRYLRGGDQENEGSLQPLQVVRPWPEDRRRPRRTMLGRLGRSDMHVLNIWS